jgi:hypothetical protein
MNPHAVLIAALAALMAWELQAPGPKPSDDFVVGVLRRDGIVTPFAAFNGRRWTVQWPNDIRARELPISLADVPKRWWGIDTPPTALTIWRDGMRAGTVALTGVTTTRLMCEPRITLKSDYRASTPVPPPFELPHPKDGLVVSGDVAVERIESVPPDSAAWSVVQGLIATTFNREETDAIRQFTDWRHPLSPESRGRVPITLEALYRAPTRDPKWTAYFVEAVRQYPPGPQDKDGCGLATFASGWILIGSSGEIPTREVSPREVKMHLTATVAYCDR